VKELLECMDDLDRAVEHAGSSNEVEPLARGVVLVRDRFLASMQKSGIDTIRLDGEPFDPNLAEASRVDPVDDPEREGTVMETIRPGYRLGELVIRPAVVAVGKLLKS
jgi:molecular chaperone GrpE